MEIQDWLGKDNELGINIWNSKYRNNNESFEQWLDRVSGGNTDLRDLIKNKKFLPGGRILANRGLSSENRKVTLSNCYVMKTGDSIEEIFETAKKLARTFSYGGGVGIDISTLAPRGATIHNAAKTTTGAVSFMDLYSMVTGLIGQEGRRGALMISLACDHPDIEEFVNIKNDLNKVTSANISVRVTDEFMDAVVNDKDFKLSFTREETGEKIEKVIKAKELFHTIAKNNWDTGEPGVLFWDTINDWNILSEDANFEYAGVNPCVTGDTLILTDKGYVSIDSVVNQNVNIWNGIEFSNVIPKITGYNQEINLIKFSNGSELKCTPYHKFILADGSRVEANTLAVGDKLCKFDMPVIDMGETVEEKIAYTQGFFMGDGYTQTLRKKLYIKLYPGKHEVLQFIEKKHEVYCPSGDSICLTLPNRSDLYNKDFVPNTKYSIKSRLDWLAGYIDSDGSLNSKDGSITITSINRNTLNKVKLMMNTLGCIPVVSLCRKEGDRRLPKNDGSGKYQMYHCKEIYRLTIKASDVIKLQQLGLQTKRVKLIADPNRDACRFISVVSNEKIGVSDKVYCFNEPKNHSGVFNGIMTGQCAEEPLPDGGSCLLGSFNLSEYVNDPFTENANFDFVNFHRDVEDAIIALNEILDEGLPLHSLKEQKDSVGDWRQIGCGIFGLADMLLKLQIRYGSEKSLKICDKIGKTFSYAAIYKSAKLAALYGSYPQYNESVLNSDYIKNNTDEATLNVIKENGLRNSQLLTIAPTGSIGTMLGVSTGAEPIYSNSYIRTTKSLHGKDVEYKVYTPIVKEYMDSKGLSDESELPKYFVTTNQILYKDRIKMQSTWQKHIDASISSTINVPESFTVEDIEDLYIEAWKNGLKGVTVFRENCRRVGILSQETSSEKEEKLDDILKRGEVIRCSDDAVGRKRRLITGCGSLHCAAFFNPKTGDLLETYLSKGSTGGCNNFMIGLSRMISIAARSGCSIDNIVDQLQSCGTCPSYAIRKATKGDTSSGSCCPMAIGYALKDMWEEMQKTLKKENVTKEIINNKTESKDTCPECGSELKHENGCMSCNNCGWSRCV